MLPTYQTAPGVITTLDMVDTEKQLLTRREAAKALSISIRLVDKLVATGDLPAVRIGKSVRFRPSALEYLIEARESRGPKRRKGVSK